MSRAVHDSAVKNRHPATSKPGRYLLEEALQGLDLRDSSGRVVPERLPFSLDDVTAGTETELQVAVRGQRKDVDLPRTIEESNYFANALRRSAAGDLPKRLVDEIEKLLGGNAENVWENSWVRFDRGILCRYADQVLEGDLRADKSLPDGPRRTDASRFVFISAGGREMVRVPVSYLVKLAMAQFIGVDRNLPFLLRETGIRLMDHYLNDNTSPETFSFYVVPLRKSSGMGLAVARETSKRMLLTQLLVMYANRSFGLMESGQSAMVYFAPHPPLRQKALNEHISDSFYRDLFMSPCLSGWDRGEEKYRYNHAPVSGVVTAVYGIDGACHSCNPSAVIAVSDPLSKNRRVVTLIDTDVDGGSRVGLVAMVEVVAMMIGDIVQCASDDRYDNPKPVTPGLFLKKGAPKSLFRPGSSTVVLLFQKERVVFSRDLLDNQMRTDVGTRFSAWLERPVVETEVAVRSTIGRRSCHV